MKKIFSIVAFCLISICSFASDIPTCTIEGYDCWSIAQLVLETEIAKGENEKDVYINPALEEKGISVNFYGMFRDGGSVTYNLSNGVSLFYPRGFQWNPDMDYVEITLPGDSQKRLFIFDIKGHMIFPVFEKSCTVNNISCGEMEQELNKLTAQAENHLKLLNLTGAKDPWMEQERLVYAFYEDVKNFTNGEIIGLKKRNNFPVFMELEIKDSGGQKIKFDILREEDGTFKKGVLKVFQRINRSREAQMY